MARRNKKKTKSEGFIVPAPFAMFVVLGAVLCLGYLWLGIRCEAIGREIKNLEAQSREIRTKRLYEESCWANAKAPGQIEKALEKHGLVMMWPNNNQVIRIAWADVVEATSSDVYGGAAQGGIRRIAMND